MNTNSPNYFDNASTTPIDKRVLDKMLPYFTKIFGNASSNHSYGKKAKQAIENARVEVAQLLNADKSEIIFTSGATESINLAIKGYVEENVNKGNHIITVKTEHKAVLATCEYLETRGYEVTYLNVDENGLISLQDLKKAIKNETILISVMYVNNEIGVIQTIKEIGKIAKENNITFFTDATQAVGKIEIDVENDMIDMLCFSAHKIKGPKGIGVLYKRKGIQITPLIHGGGQENGLRGGTYNTPLIVGLSEACKIALAEKENNIKQWKVKRQEIIEYYEKNNLGVLNFKNTHVVPNIISITLNDFEGDEFLMIKHKEFVASTGSACNAELIEPSHVLKSIDKLNPKRIIRISF